MTKTSDQDLKYILAYAITRIAQVACRNGESGDRKWPPLHTLAHLESWSMVGEQYAREMMTDLARCLVFQAKIPTPPPPEESLAQACARLDGVLLAAEDCFIAHFDVDADVPMALQDTSNTRLRYAKKGDSHGFFVVTESSMNPLLAAKLGQKTEAATLMSALWSACEKNQREDLQRIQGFIAKVEAFVGTHKPRLPHG